MMMIMIMIMAMIMILHHDRHHSFKKKWTVKIHVPGSTPAARGRPTTAIDLQLGHLSQDVEELPIGHASVWDWDPLVKHRLIMEKPSTMKPKREMSPTWGCRSNRWIRLNEDEWDNSWKKWKKARKCIDKLQEIGWHACFVDVNCSRQPVWPKGTNQ